MKKSFRLSILTALAALAAIAPAALYHVSGNVGALNGGGTYYAYFGLTDGAATPSFSSSVTITNLLLSGGAFDPTPTTFGSFAALPGGFQLTDDGGFGLAAYGFSVTSAGATISFDVETQESLPSGSDDYFLYSILDSSFSSVVTDSPLGGELVAGSLGQTTTDLVAYNPVQDGSVLSGIGKATVVASLGSVPSPAGFTVFGASMLSLLRRRRNARKVVA